jgi:hypothetical protein
MKISINLRGVLVEYGLDSHGIILEIAKALDVNRHAIGKLYNGRATSISLDLLGRLCAWLAGREVPMDQLPGALFTAGRTALWDAIAQSQGEVTVYLGEYQSRRDPVTGFRWISRRDSSVTATVVQELSRGAQGRFPAPPLKLEYVPFRYSPEDLNIDETLFAQDIERTRMMFAAMQAKSKPGTTIIIGSQRVNYLLEYFIAELFGCQPFSSPSREAHVPFFSVYRRSDLHTPSCFGGRHNPFRRKERAEPGLHYLKAPGTWTSCPWKLGEKDAGIVITMNDIQNKAITLAIFGFTGRATEAIAEQLLLKEKEFWPPCVRIKSREIGIYVCDLSYAPSNEEYESQGLVDVKDCKVNAMSEQTLKGFLWQ